MTIDLPSPAHLALERRAVLDDLALAMLFVDRGHVTLDPEPPDDLVPPLGRVLRATVTPHTSTTAARTAALLCRVLHNLRVPGIDIVRVADGLLMRCRYRLPTGAWTVELRVPSLPDARAESAHPPSRPAI